MKKGIINSIFLAAAFSASLALTACHDDIYGAINNEVKLNSSGLRGDIHSMVHYKNYLLTCNGKIYYKTNQPSYVTGKTNGQWIKTTSTPGEKGDNDIPATTYFLASDSNYLYALTYTWKENDDGENEPSKATLYATDSDPSQGLDWKEVPLPENAANDYGNVKILFDNKYFSPESSTVNLVNRSAFARIRTNTSLYGIYKLDGTTLNKIDPTNDSDNYQVIDDTNAQNIISACYFNGKTYFSPYYAMTSNSNYLYYSKTRTSSNNVDRDSKLYYRNASNEETAVDPDKGGILSMAAAKDYILLGTSSGLARASIDSSGKPTDRYPKMPSNGESVISEYVFMVFILDPGRQEGSSNPEIGTDEYASSTIYGSIRSSSDSWDDTGLYAWYPSENEWNRDGD
ncbi:hypothetical protein [Treponema sp.]|uniref:hypothetical protein n=1 Tax=Treponema sp. TaxID=166 RepID=UPI003EFE290F